MRRTMVWALGCAALAGAVLGSGPSAAQQAPSVVVAPAALQDVREGATFRGRLDAIQRVDLQARVAGFLRAVNFTEGAVTPEGAVLFEIEDDEYRARVQEAQGAVAAAEAALRLTEIERDRQATLVAREAVAQQQLDIAEANLGRAAGELTRLRASLARAELDLSYTRVLAPFTGIAGLTRQDVGAFVGPASGPLTTLTRLDPMRAEFPVPTATLMDFRAGATGDQPLSVTLTLPNGMVYPQPGVIDFTDARVAQGADTVLVRAAFPNPDGLLLDGALVGVALQLDAPQLVLSVPRRAIQRDQVGGFVLVVGPDGVVEQRRVSVARSTRDLAVIAAGLTEGEQVIVDGVNRVRPGIRVDAVLASEG